MVEFKGVVPAIVTPMTPEGEVNEAAFRELIDFNIGAGAHGFWVAGGGGECVLLTDDENKRLAEIAVEQAAGRAFIIMHVGTLTTRSSAALAEHAARVGADAICCVPPFFYRIGEDAVIEHYRTVAAAADLPLFVYNLPQSTGVEITPDYIKKIADRVPQLVGLKHSAPEFTNTVAFVKMGLRCFTGNARLMLASLTLGGAGCVDGAPCAAPEPWVEIWNAYQEDDQKGAEAAQRRATEVQELLIQAGAAYPANVKALASERLGVELGDPRLPIPPATAEQRAWIRQEAERLDLLGVAV